MPARLGAGYWRERAEEARAEADQMCDRTASRTLLDIAENYDQLAAQAERMRMASFRRDSSITRRWVTITMPDINKEIAMSAPRRVSQSKLWR